MNREKGWLVEIADKGNNDDRNDTYYNANDANRSDLFSVFNKKIFLLHDNLYGYIVARSGCDDNLNGDKKVVSTRGFTVLVFVL